MADVVGRECEVGAENENGCELDTHDDRTDDWQHGQHEHDVECGDGPRCAQTSSQGNCSQN